MKLEITRREWTRRIEQWRSSGKNAKVWCRENNLVYSTFMGWTHRINRPSKIRPSFIELKDPPPPSSGITLECDNIRINFVFINKMKDKMKVLYWDNDGFAIWWKRLEQGSFRLLGIDRAMIDRKEFFMLLEGITPKRIQKRFKMS